MRTGRMVILISFGAFMFRANFRQKSADPRPNACQEWFVIMFLIDAEHLWENSVGKSAVSIQAR